MQLCEPIITINTKYMHSVGKTVLAEWHLKWLHMLLTKLLC